MDATLYLVSIPPRFIPDRWGFYDNTSKSDRFSDDDDDKPKKFKNKFRTDSVTGY